MKIAEMKRRKTAVTLSATASAVDTSLQSIISNTKRIAYPLLY